MSSTKGYGENMRAVMGWLIFLCAFLSIYGGMHLYAYLKAQSALRLIGLARTGATTVITMMILSIILARVFERKGFTLRTGFLSRLSYFWFGLLFVFISVAIMIDLFRLFVFIQGRIFQQDFSRLMPSAEVQFFLPLVMAIVLNIYGYFEGWHIFTETISVKTDKLPPGLNRLRIVQVSDVHLGLMVGERRLKHITDLINKTNPDILVSTGDLLDSTMPDAQLSADLLQGIQTTYGKYAVTGNHEFYAGIDRAVAFTQRAGFTLLRNEGVTVAGMINIAGVDDSTGKRLGQSNGLTEKDVLFDLPEEKYTVLLKHTPVVDEKALGLFDLQLSGHAHKGQIFPFSLITNLIYVTDNGWLNLPGGSHLYVSRGTGVWGPPIRLFAPPEITIIDLMAA